MQYEFDWGVLWRYRAMLLDGFGVTLALSVVGLGLAITIGVLVGGASVSRNRAAAWVAAGYVEIARGLPLLIHMYGWYFGLTALRLPGFWCAVLALGSYSGAYVAEIVRAGLRGVAPGQSEAGLASGLSRGQVFFSIVLPQALADMAPSLAGVFSQLIKDSSLASVIGVAELTFSAGAIEGETFKTFEAYVGITLLYLVAVTGVTRVSMLAFARRAGDAAVGG